MSGVWDCCLLGLHQYLVPKTQKCVTIFGLFKNIELTGSPIEITKSLFQESLAQDDSNTMFQKDIVESKGHANKTFNISLQYHNSNDTHTNIITPNKT